MTVYWVPGGVLIWPIDSKLADILYTIENPDKRPSVTLPSEEEIVNPIEEVVDLLPSEPVGFNINTFTRLITQMHCYVQILGQSIVMGMGLWLHLAQYSHSGVILALQIAKNIVLSHF